MIDIENEQTNGGSTEVTAQDYSIHVNFLRVARDFPYFTVYRKLRLTSEEARPFDSATAYHLPTAFEQEGGWPEYWVSVEPFQDFEPWQCDPNTNHYLTRRVLFWTIVSSIRKSLEPSSYLLSGNSFIEAASIVQRSHAEGDELLVIEPYYLKATHQFGYLVDFHFRLREGVPFSRRVQQLSLSLDKNYRRNLDYYVDRYSKTMAFVKDRDNIFQTLTVPGQGGRIVLEKDFVSLPASRLRTKVYVFGGNRESKSQFVGLRDYGPLQGLSEPPRLLFIFREQDRQAARRLAIGLKGTRSRERFGFPGFKALFKCDIVIDGDPVILPSLDRPAIEAAVNRAKAVNPLQSSILPVVVLPTNDDSYLIQKSLFSEAGIATQACTLRILQNEDTLKWAIANLALQVFCKAGGFPWKVRPTNDRSLIIGISQSHKTRHRNGVQEVEKYFAFSVLTDSSGLFRKIQVLGEDSNEVKYIEKLQQSLGEVLKESAGEFSRVVIHSSFRLKHREMDAIQATVKEIAAEVKSSGCKFAVVKVNQKSRFFGINRAANSLVPYEATKVRLGPGEYLVWFEGIFPDRPTVNKAFPGPTHIQILRVSEEYRIPDETLLQDLVNLSGANWRGFNAKGTPVSVFYCHLVAQYVRDFYEKNLPLPAVKDLRPWFL